MYVCVCTKVGAARKGVGVLLCNGGNCLESKEGNEDRRGKGRREEGMKKCGYKGRKNIKQQQQQH